VFCKPCCCSPFAVSWRNRARISIDGAGSAMVPFWCASSKPFSTSPLAGRHPPFGGDFDSFLRDAVQQGFQNMRHFGHVLKTECAAAAFNECAEQEDGV